VTRAALMLLLLSAAAGEVFACSCAGDPLAERLDGSEVVARVRVEAIRFNPAYAEVLRDEAPDEFVEPLRLDFTLVESLKGRLTDDTVLLTGWGGGDCGLEVKPGEDLLVAGVPEDGVIHLNFCSPSRPLPPLSLFEQAGRKVRMRDADRYYLGAVRDYLLRGEPIPECVESFHGVAPPPPPPGEPDPVREACEARYPAPPEDENG
jgi:hypothetical protein